MLIIKAAAKRLAARYHKRLGEDYIEYLDKRLEEIIRGHALMMDDKKKTLKAKHARELDAYRMTRL